jgi:hypothetical protein
MVTSPGSAASTALGFSPGKIFSQGIGKRVVLITRNWLSCWKIPKPYLSMLCFCVMGDA